MNKMKNYEKDILFYLEEIEKEVVKSKLILLFEDDEYLSPYEIVKKNEYIKETNNLKNKFQRDLNNVSLVYFNEDFKKEAKNLTKDDKEKKQALLNYIQDIRNGNKKNYTEEKFKCYNGFLYSLFVAKFTKNEFFK